MPISGLGGGNSASISVPPAADSTPTSPSEQDRRRNKRRQGRAGVGAAGALASSAGPLGRGFVVGPGPAPRAAGAGPAELHVATGTTLKTMDAATARARDPRSSDAGAMDQTSRPSRLTPAITRQETAEREGGVNDNGGDDISDDDEGAWSPPAKRLRIEQGVGRAVDQAAAQAVGEKIGHAVAREVGLEIGPETGHVVAQETGREVNQAVAQEVEPDIDPGIDLEIDLEIDPEIGLEIDPEIDPEIGQAELPNDRLLRIMVTFIEDSLTPREKRMLRDLVNNLKAHPRGKVLWAAMQKYDDVFHEAPEIILRKGPDADQPRPFLQSPDINGIWYLDLEALSNEPLDCAVDELAAICDDLTEVTAGNDPFAGLIASGRGQPPLDPQLEAAWREWIIKQYERAAVIHPLAARRADPESIIRQLRSQLREPYFYGGVSRQRFLEILEGEIQDSDEIDGLYVDLSRSLDEDQIVELDIPPLPGDVYALNVSNVLIQDWSHLPSGLKILNASKTGGNGVLKYLPSDLIELDISSNDLGNLGGFPSHWPSGLKRLYMDDNELTDLVRLPDTVTELSVRRNALRNLATNLPRDLRSLDASDNRLSSLAENWPCGIQWLDVGDNDLVELARLPDTVKTLIANNNMLTRLRDDLHPGLRTLKLNKNHLTRLPASINALTNCAIDLADNPISGWYIPRPTAGQSGPKIQGVIIRDSVDTFEASAMPRVEQQVHPVALGDVLLRRIRGAMTSRQTEMFSDLLNRVKTHPRGKVIWDAFQNYYDLFKDVPEIVLREGPYATHPRPFLGDFRRLRVWALALDALSTGPLDTVVNEFGAVYAQLSGLAKPEGVFADRSLQDRLPPLEPELEAKWSRWIIEQSNRADGSRFRHWEFIRDLRFQLQQARFYAGVNRLQLLNVISTRSGNEVPGLNVKLSTRHISAISSIPPLPDDLYGLDVSDIAIKDWSNLPRYLKFLRAANTGGNEVLKHLPPDLISLDISSNYLGSLGGFPSRWPPGLQRLAMDRNGFEELPYISATVKGLSVRGNRLRNLINVPRGVWALDASENQLSSLDVNALPDLRRLILAANNFRRLPDLSMLRLDELRVAGNRELSELSRLPNTLRVLDVRSCNLEAFTENFPLFLEELYASRNRLNRLPDDFPLRLRRLDLSGNRLSRLPANIMRLSHCEIQLERNPIAPENIPTRSDGQPGPRFFYSMWSFQQIAMQDPGSLVEAVRGWLGDAMSEDVAAYWDRIGRTRAREETVAFSLFLSRLRGTVCYRYAEFRASILELLGELSKPEREPLLVESLQVCADANEGCDDRVLLVLDELRIRAVRDDIRLGRYDGRVAEGVEVIRQLFCVKLLREIAEEKIESMDRVDDVEVYLGYTVMLRVRLKLTMVVPDMQFFRVSKLTLADLDTAFDKISKDTGFYRYLVLDDTWSALLKRKFGAIYEEAERRLHELAGDHLQKETIAKLQEQGLDPDNLEAYREMSSVVWGDLKYRILEPFTSELCKDAGVPRPAGALPHTPDHALTEP